MCPTRTRPRVYWRRLLWGMYLGPKTWQSCYQTGRGYRKVCRWDWRLWVLRKRFSESFNSRLLCIFSPCDRNDLILLAGVLGWRHRCMGHQGGTCWDQGCEVASAAAASYGCGGGSQSWGQSEGENGSFLRGTAANLWLCVSVPDHCRRGWNESVQGPERGLPGHRWVTVSPSAAIPAEPQLHRSREELHHHLPPPHRHAAEFHVKKVKNIKIVGKITLLDTACIFTERIWMLRFLIITACSRKPMYLLLYCTVHSVHTVESSYYYILK